MDSKIDYLKESVEKLVELLGVENTNVDVYEEDGVLFVNINGEDLGHFIGYHGENIQALQNIYIAALGRKFDEVGSLVFDIEGYRRKREDKVRDVARNAAKKVSDFNKAYKMNPMHPADRRIVHMEISENYPNLISYSVGEGYDRRVVISKNELE